jgi:replication-associated recombination protein RarA
MSNMQNSFAPTSLDDFVISDSVSELTLKTILNGRLAFPLMKQAICLWGTYGTGKTTLAQLLPGLLEASGKLLKSQRPGSLFGGDYYMHVTPCGAGANAVSVMQDMNKRMASDASYSPSGWHYEILDEVDLLTTTAQASLKSLITQASSTIFVFTTNHLPRLDGGLVDRSLLIEMNQPKPEQMEVMGRRFLRQMGMIGDEISAEKLHAMAKASRGSVRDFGTTVVTAGLQAQVLVSS